MKVVCGTFSSILSCLDYIFIFETSQVNKVNASIGH